MAFPVAVRRVLRSLAPALVWLGAGIAVILTLLSLAADRLRGQSPDLAAAAGVVATFAFSAALPWTLTWKRLVGFRRYLVTCVVATLLVFVTRPEAIIGGSVALAGGAIGVLREL